MAIVFQNDCGPYCAQLGAGCGGSNQPCVYYQCSGSNCSGVNLPENQQVPNPVIAFTGDNNGVLVQLPPVPNGGSSNPSGSLIFGISTQSNNNLSMAANVYAIPDSGNEAGDFIYIKPGVPHEVFNMSDTEPVVAFVARSSADEWDNIIPYDRNASTKAAEETRGTRITIELPH